MRNATTSACAPQHVPHANRTALLKEKRTKEEMDQLERLSLLIFVFDSGERAKTSQNQLTKEDHPA